MCDRCMFAPWASVVKTSLNLHQKPVRVIKSLNITGCPGGQTGLCEMLSEEGREQH